MTSARVNMDLCYSDTFHDFTGVFANYHLNKYLSRGLTSDEYVKIFPCDIEEARSRLQKRFEYGRHEQAFSTYELFCKDAYFSESDIRDFFGECLNFVRWCVTEGKQQGDESPFSIPIVSEILEDLARIVYRNDDQGKLTLVMKNLAEAFQEVSSAQEPYIRAEPLFAKVLLEWDVSIDFVGDDHGQRMKSIFCAESFGNQKSANSALARGFHQYYLSCPEDDKFPIHALPEAKFPIANCYFWFVNNPFRTNDLTEEFMRAACVKKVGSKGDFFHQFPFTKPWLQAKNLPSGQARDQRVALLSTLAVGKNFLHRNPECSLLVPGLDDVSVFGETKVTDWVNGMIRAPFAENCDWQGRTTLMGDARPGLYIDAASLEQVIRDENSLAAVLAPPDPVPEMTPEEVREMYIGLAPKHLKDVIVPGELEQIAQIERGKKRKRVDTGEKGTLPSVPLEVEKKKKPNPKEEADNSTLFYGILAIGTFIGVLFLNR